MNYVTIRYLPEHKALQRGYTALRTLAVYCNSPLTGVPGIQRNDSLRNVCDGNDGAWWPTINRALLKCQRNGMPTHLPPEGVLASR